MLPGCRGTSSTSERAVVLHFDLGTALVPANREVADRIRGSLPVDLALFAGGVVIGILLGVGGGALAALAPRGLAARAAEMPALFALAAPSTARTPR